MQTFTGARIYTAYIYILYVYIYNAVQTESDYNTQLWWMFNF